MATEEVAALFEHQVSLHLHPDRLILVEPNRDNVASIQKYLEDRAKDVAYTAVGLGIFAYRYSQPHRDRAAAIAREAWAEHGERCEQDLQEVGRHAKSWFDHLSGEVAKHAQRPS
jgi:hypothetical protein